MAKDPESLSTATISLVSSCTTSDLISPEHEKENLSNLTNINFSNPDSQTKIPIADDHDNTKHDNVQESSAISKTSLGNYAKPSLYNSATHSAAHSRSSSRKSSLSVRSSQSHSQNLQKSLSQMSSRPSSAGTRQPGVLLEKPRANAANAKPKASGLGPTNKPTPKSIIASRISKTQKRMHINQSKQNGAGSRETIMSSPKVGRKSVTPTSSSQNSRSLTTRLPVPKVPSFSQNLSNLQAQQSSHPSGIPSRNSVSSSTTSKSIPGSESGRTGTSNINTKDGKPDGHGPRMTRATALRLERLQNLKKPTSPEQPDHEKKQSPKSSSDSTRSARSANLNSAGSTAASRLRKANAPNSNPTTTTKISQIASRQSVPASKKSLPKFKTNANNNNVNSNLTKPTSKVQHSLSNISSITNTRSKTKPNQDVNATINVSSTSKNPSTQNTSSTLNSTTIINAKSLSTTVPKNRTTINCGPNKYSEKIKKLETQISSLKISTDQLTSQLTFSKSSLTDLEINNKLLSEEAVQDKLKLSEKENLQTLLENEIMSQKLSGNAQIEALQSEVEIISAENCKSKSDLASAVSKLQTLDQAFKNEQTLFNQYKIEAVIKTEKFEKTISDLESDVIPLLKKEIESLMICLEENKIRLETVTAEKDELAENFEKDLQAKFDKELSRFKNPKNEIDSLNEVLIMRSEENKSLRTKIEAQALKLFEVDEIKGKAIEMECLNKQLKEELSDQKIRFRNLKFDHDALVKEFKNKNNYVKTTERQVEALEFKLDQMSSQIMSESQMNLSAIPVSAALDESGLFPDNHLPLASSFSPVKGARSASISHSLTVPANLDQTSTVELPLSYHYQLHQKVTKKTKNRKNSKNTTGFQSKTRLIPKNILPSKLDEHNCSLPRNNTFSAKEDFYQFEMMTSSSEINNNSLDNSSDLNNSNNFSLPFGDGSNSKDFEEKSTETPTKYQNQIQKRENTNKFASPRKSNFYKSFNCKRDANYGQMHSHKARYNSSGSSNNSSTPKRSGVFNPSQNMSQEMLSTSIGRLGSGNESHII